MKIVALKSVLSVKAKNNEIMILDKLSLNENKTKKIIEILKNLKALKKPIVIIEKEDKNIEQAIRNIQGAIALPVSKLNSYDLLNHGKAIFTKEAIKQIEEVLS